MNQFFKILLFITLLGGFSCKEQRYPGPLTPEEALDRFQVRDGFRIELFAAEPHVLDPVEMVFDEQGNAYVAEMPDYPFMPEQGEGLGRIRLLQDTDGDGQVDNSVIFADSILEATSMLPWEGGLLVTAAPHILYLKDTDGDLRADQKEVVFSGFFENNSEAQITSLRFGVDNWIYAANNGQAGTVHFNRIPEAPALAMSGADFRFRLDRNEFEQESGGGQFGLTMDDWGNRFITQNTLHIRQVVIPWRYTHRHAFLPSTNSNVNISDHDLDMFQITPPPYWRAERTRRRNIQYKEQNLDRTEYAEDKFTGCSGGTVYDGDAFPPEYYGNVFTGDVSGNLVHRDVLISSSDRAVLTAKRDETEKDREFLATTDSWFRPSGFTVGPDGYLYVIDMYRQHIETPLSIPEDLKEDMDFLAGSDMGRIYRIVPVNGAHDRNNKVDLRAMSTADLVKQLTNDNRWWRLQAQRLLLERQDASAVPAARELFTTHKDPRVRLHALYVLEGQNALDADLVAKAMADEHPGVRKHGLILSERFPELLPRVLAMIDDATAEVALQATLTAGNSGDKRIDDAFATILSRHGEDDLFRMAVLSSKKGSSVSFLNNLVRNHAFLEKSGPWKEAFMKEFAYTIGAANEPQEISSFLDVLAMKSFAQEAALQVAGVDGLKRGMLRSAGSDTSRKETLENIQTGSPEQAQEAIRNLRSLNEKKNNI